MSRIRANTIVDSASTGAPTFPNGAIINGITTITADVATTGNNLTIGTGTTISNPSNNEFRILTNGSERVRVGSGGSVGIGTDDPQTKLHIDGTNNTESRITISRTGFLRNNFIGLDGDADELVIAADEGNQGGASLIKFKVDGTEEIRIDSNGLKFNGDTAAANALYDYEEGNITNWRLVKDDASTAGSNNAGTVVRYTKIGRCVYINGYIRTDNTEGSRSGNLLLRSTADGSTAVNLPFVPNHTGGIPIIHTRTVDELTNTMSLAFSKDSASLFIYNNEHVNDYVPDTNNLSTNTQTNIAITFSGHYFTDS